MLIFGFFLSIFFLVVYSLGVSPSVFGGDSGDIVLSYFFAGVPHPPGYPLNTILGWIFTRLPIGETFAYRANFVSAIYSAISCGLLFYLLTKLTKNFLVSLCGALVLGFVPLFWLYAHVAEVFQLSLVLILLSLIPLFEWWNSCSLKKPKIKFLFLSVFFLGLCVFHHQTTGLLIPAYVYVLFKTRKGFILKRKNLFLLSSSFLGGFLPYIYVPFAAIRATPINWDDPSNLLGFWRLVTRADYGTFSAARDMVGFTLKERLAQILWYFMVLKADFTLAGIILVLIGVIWLFFKKREWFWFFTLAAVFTGPFFLFYASFPPTDPFIQGVSERFFLVSYIFITIFLSFGILACGKLLIRLISKFILRRESVSLLVGLGFLLFPMSLAIINWVRTDLSNYCIGSDLGLDILSSADPPGIIFLQGDTIVFNTEYSYYVDKFNNDSKILLAGRFRHPSYRKQLKKQYPDLSFTEIYNSSEVIDPEKPIRELIESNYKRMPIYSVVPMPSPKEVIWIKQGMLFRLYKKDQAPSRDDLVGIIKEKVKKLHVSEKSIRGQYKHLFTENIISTYVGAFVENGYALLNREKVNESQEYFKFALSLQEDYKPAIFGLALSDYELKNCQESEKLFLQLTEIDSSYWQAWNGLGNVYKDCFGDEEKSKEYFEKAQTEKKKQSDTPIEKF